MRPDPSPFVSQWRQELAAPRPDGFVADPNNVPGARIELFHLHGVPWFEAQTPSRFHRCTAQTRAWDVLTLIERCACGAIRLDSHGWIDRNQSRTRKKPAPTRRDAWLAVLLLSAAFAVAVAAILLAFGSVR